MNYATFRQVCLRGGPYSVRFVRPAFREQRRLSSTELLSTWRYQRCNPIRGTISEIQWVVEV